MALASRKSGDLHDKTGSDLAAMKTKFDNNKHLAYSGVDVVDVLLYQIQLLREYIDELRRYIVSAELLVDAGGGSLPTSDPRSSGALWNNRGVVSVSS